MNGLLEAFKEYVRRVEQAGDEWEMSDEVSAMLYGEVYAEAKEAIERAERTANS